jgi:hypothetical protein
MGGDENRRELVYDGGFGEGTLTTTSGVWLLDLG